MTGEQDESRTIPGVVGVSSPPHSLMGDGRRLSWTMDHSVVPPSERGTVSSRDEKPLWTPCWTNPALSSDMAFTA